MAGIWVSTKRLSAASGGPSGCSRIDRRASSSPKDPLLVEKVRDIAGICMIPVPPRIFVPVTQLRALV
jgi:hypothetical protein